MINETNTLDEAVDFHKEKLYELIFQALGEASVCWNPKPEGVFDSQHAGEVGEKLLQDIVSTLNA